MPVPAPVAMKEKDMREARIPAQAFAPGEFIRDEMSERGWSLGDLVSRMGGQNGEELAIDCFAVELALECFEEPELLLGEELARGLAKAFGTSAAMWLNIDASWRAWLTARAALSKAQP